MPSTPHNAPKSNRAEQQFRLAFERLKQNRPVLLPRGTKLSQNNVAKEAGVDPSALRKSRFPLLVAEIQRWLEEHPGDQPSASKKRIAQDRRAKGADLHQRMELLRSQRDHALSRLVEAEAKILELVVEVERLRSFEPPSNVQQMSDARRRKHSES